MVVPISLASINPYEVMIANSQELRKVCYQIRHQVYCVERRFESPNIKAIETDSFDIRAMHFLVRHTATDHFFGTARAILPLNCDAPPPPVFTLCEQHGIALPPEITPKNCVEISRFALSRELTKANGVSPTLSQVTDNPLALKAGLKLIGAIYQTMRAKKIPYCCAVMAKALPRLLSWQGIHLTPVGPCIDFHGKRQIFYASEQEFTKMLTQLPDDVNRLFRQKPTHPKSTRKTFAFTII